MTRTLVQINTKSDWYGGEYQVLKLVEEFGELSTGLQKKNDFYIEDAIGDCAVVLCIIAAQCGMSFGKCLESAWDEIKDRRGQVVNGVFVKEVSK